MWVLSNFEMCFGPFGIFLPSSEHMVQRLDFSEDEVVLWLYFGDN